MKLKFEKVHKRNLTRKMVTADHWYRSRENPDYYFHITEPGTEEERYEYRKNVIDTSESGLVLLARGQIKH